MTRFETIKFRYGLGYIRDDQLLKYLEYQVITQEEYNEIIGA